MAVNPLLTIIAKVSDASEDYMAFGFDVQHLRQHPQMR
jgi:hypothetical protein